MGGMPHITVGTPIIETLDHDGFVVVEDVLDAESLVELITGIEKWRANSAGNQAANLRTITAAIPEIARLCWEPRIPELAEAVIGSDARVVRSLFFDKTATSNWKVAWHQDLTIAVREKRNVPGYSPWSMKAGIPHVQPPAAVLERMITLRIHLDDCHENNGALKVLPGSHREGKLAPAQIESWRQRSEPVTCAVRKGGVLLMRPLLLHASSPASNPSHRRVIHLEFAAEELADGLRWLEPPQPAPRVSMKD